jgi:hypothetical protein
MITPAMELPSTKAGMIVVARLWPRSSKGLT